MFKTIEAPSDVIAFALSGKLAAHDMRQYQTVFADQLASQDTFGLCMDVTGLSDITAPGVAAGAKADIQALRHIRRFKRLAVVSDKEWPSTLVSFLDTLLPTLDAKVFAPDQRNQAVKWASPTSGARQAPARDAHKRSEPAIRLVPTSRADVIAFEIDGALDAASVAAIVDEVESRLAAHEHIRMLANIRRFGGVNPDLFGTLDRLISMKLHAVGKLERYAIVGAPGWMAKVAEAISVAVPGSEIKAFDAGQEDEAWRWIGAERA